MTNTKATNSQPAAGLKVRTNVKAGGKTGVSG